MPKVCWAAELMLLPAERTPLFNPSRSVFVASLNAFCARPVIDCGWPAAGDVFCGYVLCG